MCTGISNDLREVNDTRTTILIARELTRLNIIIDGLHETRLASGGSLREENYTFFWKGWEPEEPRQYGVGFVIRNNLVALVKHPTWGTERLLSIRFITAAGPVNIISVYANEVSLTGDKLRINAPVMKSLFSNATQSTVSHVKELMKDKTVRSVSSILIVGGFSGSKMLQHAIRSSFPNIKVIIPHEAGLVVLKGAVVYGHSPSSVSHRVCKYTYGVDMECPFIEKQDDILKRIERDHGPQCKDIFDTYVEIGQSVAINVATKEHSYTPSTESQSAVIFKIYASTQKSPMYVTDDGCVKLGYVRVNILDKSVPRAERGVRVSMTFGGTEIEVTAREERTGHVTKAIVNFLG